MIMKKILIVFTLILCAGIKLSANDADLFNYDKSAVQNSLSQLSVLESYVTEHPALVKVQREKDGIVIVNGIALTSNPMQGRGWSPVPFPYFWGCVLGPIGVVIVMAGTNGDRRAQWLAMEGCITAVVFWSLLFFIWYAPTYHYGYNYY